MPEPPTADAAPAIHVAPAVNLPAAAAPVLAVLFADYLHVSVERELAGGFSGACVLTVTPYRDAGTPELPSVVKLGPADLIRQEYDAYRRHIRGRLSGIPEVWGEPKFSRDGTWGGLRYALVGAGLFEFVSLARFTGTASAGDLAHVLESRVFVHLGTIWRQSRAIADAPLGMAYTDFLRPGLADFFSLVLGTDTAKAIARGAPTIAPPDRPRDALPNPLVALPVLLSAPIPHRVATIHGDLNLENVLVDPVARTVHLIDFSLSREDHVLHDLLRLETGFVTRVLPTKLSDAGMDASAVIDLYRRLHTAADDAPPEPALLTVYIGLVAVRKAAIPLLADPDNWREYLVGLAAYLVGAGKYRNLDDGAKAVAFWAAATALDLAAVRPAADVDALERAIPVLLERNPAVDAYRRGRIAEWSGPRYELDDRFVDLSLLIDQGEESASGRWQEKEKRYPSLSMLLGEVSDPALVILGAPGSGKSTLMRRLELEVALAGLGDVEQPLTFFIPLNHYKPARKGDPPPSPRAWLAEQWSARFPMLPPLGDLLAEGRMILLLDALNEIPAASASEARERVAAWKDFAQEMASTTPPTRVIFSCRSLDYSTPLSTPALRVPQVRVEPLTDEKVYRFLGQYIPHRAEGLWATLVASGHVDVVRSPYFLKLLVEQVESTGDVPFGRAALFTGFVRQALTREIERDHPLFRADTLLTERDVLRLTAARAWRTPYELPERGVLVPKLGELAYRMQERSEAEGEAAQVRVDFDTALGLLAHERDADIVAAGAALGVLDEDPGRDEVLYVHQLVQEYFAARVLAKAPRPELTQSAWRAAEISPPLTDLVETLPPSEDMPALPQTGWEETVLLAAAMAADAESYVRGQMGTNLVLAGRCAGQAEVRERLGSRLLDDLRWALVERSRNPEADLRDRIACGRELGWLGDPRFERRAGARGAFLMPPLVAIAGGMYSIGDDDPIDWAWGETSGSVTDHMPRHSVEIDSFNIGQFAVTNAEWACFMAAGGYDDERWWDTEDGRCWRRGELANDAAKNTGRWWRRQFHAQPELFEQMVEEGRFVSADVAERWRSWIALDEAAFEAALDVQWQARRETEPAYWREARFNQPNQPVVGICWYEARAYCAWLSGQTGLSVRLPTEAEWEAAAGGRSGRRYAWGDAFDRLKANMYETKAKRPTPVGVFPDGATPEGAADLSGNVREWTASLYGIDDDEPEYRYPYDANDGREDAAAGADVRRVVRGGSWYLADYNARVAYRNRFVPSARNDDVGMRLVVGTHSADA